MSRLLTALALLALLASGCAQAIGNPRTAMVINGESIPIAEVEPLVAAGGVDPLTGQPTAEGDASQALSQVALLTLVAQELEELGGERPTEADVDAAVEDAVAAAGGQESFEQELATQGITEPQFRTDQALGLVADRLLAILSEDVEVTDADVELAYESQFGQPTVSHILVPTEEEAQAVIERIEAGESFEDVAREVGTDGSAAQGGLLGPLQPGQFVPEFEEAALALDPGELSGPVETQFGFHVITVDGPQELTPELREQIEADLRRQQVQPELGPLLQEALDSAEVEVNPRFGEWNPQTGPQGGLAGLISPTDPLGALQPVGAAPSDPAAAPVPAPTAAPDQ